MTQRLSRFCCLLALSMLTLSAVGHADVSGLTILRRIGKNPDGLFPDSPLIQAASGVFYGTTPQGGSHTNGTIFSVTSAGLFTTLYNFSALDGRGRNPDGANPGVLIQGSDGNFYGITAAAGAGGFGTIFRITPSGAFAVVSTCTGPCQNLLQGSDSNLYGVSTVVAAGAAEIFRLTSDGMRTAIHSFATGLRISLLQGPDGNFYGIATAAGGSRFFRLTPAGVLATLANLPNVDAGLVQGTDGNFYVLTGTGSSRPPSPLVFDRITPGGVVTTVYRYRGGDQGEPAGTPVQGRDGNFYGVDFAYGIYRLTPDGVLTTLATFGGDRVANPLAGVRRAGGVIQGVDGKLYGTTQTGGTANLGSVFSLTTGGTLTLLHSFAFGDGHSPVGALVQGRDGNLYGLTSGLDGDIVSQIGSIFKITPTGALTTLHTFDLPANDGYTKYGAEPEALAAGADGNLYGINAASGEAGGGNFFRIGPAGMLTVLHSFSYDEGLSSYTLIAGNDGNFYGTSGYGNTVFSLSPAGVEKILYTFAGGFAPYDLVQGADGIFYGTTHNSIFRLTPGGQLTVLDDAMASGNPPIHAPQGLFQGRGGNLYYTTLGGGAYRQGAVFSFTRAGAKTTLYSFTGGADGGHPSSMIQGRDGNFYGTTSASGSAVSGNGGIFQLTPTGILNTLFDFSASEGPDANSASSVIGKAALLQGSDGNFYGTTTGTTGSAAGPAGSYITYPTFQTYGTVFELPSASIASSPLLTSADTPIGVARRPFTYKITANHQTTNYAASGLPEGLRIDVTTGLISGTPTRVAASAVSLVAQTSAGTARATLSLNVVPLVTLTTATPSVSVGAGEAGVFLVSLSAKAADKVVLNYTISGSAINGTDYKRLTGTVIFQPGETSRPIDIVPKGDLNGAAKKVVKLTLAPGNGYAADPASPVKIELFDAGTE